MLVALIVLAWLAIPPIVRSQVESRLTEALGRATTLESVSFNPFTLRVTLREVRDRGSGRTRAAVRVRRAGRGPLDRLDLASRAGARRAEGRAPVDLAVARREGPLQRAGPHRPRRAPSPADRRPRFSLNNIEVDGGSLAFDDGVAGRKHKLDALNLGIPFLSSLPYQTDIRVTPRADGSFNGSHFALGGTTAPFAERREAALDIDFDALPLKDYVAYLPAKPRVDLAGGALTTRLKVVFVDGQAGRAPARPARRRCASTASA